MSLLPCFTQNVRQRVRDGSFPLFFSKKCFEAEIELSRSDSIEFLLLSLSHLTNELPSKLFLSTNAFSGFFQALNKFFWGSFQAFLRSFWGLSEVFLRSFWGLSGAYLGPAWGLSGAYMGPFWGFFEIIFNSAQKQSNRIIQKSIFRLQLIKFFSSDKKFNQLQVGVSADRLKKKK